MHVGGMYACQHVLIGVYKCLHVLSTQTALCKCMCGVFCGDTSRSQHQGLRHVLRVRS